MPVEIKELIIKATIAIDWENQTVEENQESTVYMKLPGKEEIKKYVKGYFRQQNSRILEFDQSKLADFLVKWQASFLE
ncbi:MAG: DUF5908 family protein [Ginsengibacter sp.]